MHTHIPFSRAAFIRLAHLIGFSALCVAGAFLMGVRTAGETGVLSEQVAAGRSPAEFPYGRVPDGMSQTEVTDGGVDARSAALIALRLSR